MQSLRFHFVTFIFCLLFLFFSWQPLWHTDLWGHLAFGRQLVETRSLSRLEGLLTVAPDFPLRDTAWLSQIIGYFVHEISGIAGLQILYASCLTAILLILWRVFSRDGVSVWLSSMGIAFYLGIAWEQLKIIRPQLGGLICYLLLFLLLTGRTKTRRDWFFIPAIFALWANLHGSFPIGLLMLGCFLLGDMMNKDQARVAEIDGRAKPLARHFLFFLLCLIAVCFNPYGLAIYNAVLEISANPNVKNLEEWKPINLTMNQGQWGLVAVILFVIVKLLARRKTDIAHWLLILGTGLATLWSSRMILWFAPAIVYAILLQAQRLWDRKRIPSTPQKCHSPTFLHGGLRIVILISTFFFTPLCWEFVTGKNQDPHRSLSSETPIDAVEFLVQTGGEGIVFNRFEWGDYLLWKSEGKIKPFAFSHAHLIPKDVWRDYLQILGGSEKSLVLLDRYHIDVVLIDPNRQNKLYKLLEKNSAWQVEFQNEQAVVFLRIDSMFPMDPE